MNTVVMHPSGASHVFGPVMQHPDTWQPGVCFICAGAVLPAGLSQGCLGAGRLAGCWRVCSLLVVSFLHFVAVLIHCLCHKAEVGTR